MARRALTNAPSQREPMHVLLALCLSTQGGESPLAGRPVVGLGAYSQGHWCKKGEGEGADRIMGRRMCAYALEWRQPLASAVKAQEEE